MGDHRTGAQWMGDRRMDDLRRKQLPLRRVVWIEFRQP
jgi:hypothetical protein